MTTSSLSYAIDEQDHLIKVDEGYYRFAKENGWTEAGTSLGRSLWDYVAGHEMRKLQRLLVRRIRDEVGDVELPFRCDGPELRREMDIRIIARPGGRVVLFAARLRSERAWEAPQPLLDPQAPRGEDMLAMCDWCDRFEVDGEWSRSRRRLADSAPSSALGCRRSATASAQTAARCYSRRRGGPRAPSPILPRSHG